MLDDAINAITQMFSAPLRAVLWKTIGLALGLLIAAAIALHRLIDHLLGASGASLETTLGPQVHLPVSALEWLVSLIAALSIVIGGVMLMPAVTAVVGSFFADSIADEVERRYYPSDPPGTALPLWLALWEGAKTAVLAIVIYVCAAPLIFFAGIGGIVFYFATAYILGREYFELAAMRLRPPAEAKALRKRHWDRVYIGGLLIAAFVLIPVVNLATPLFAMALMVHMHKRIGANEPA